MHTTRHGGVDKIFKGIHNSGGGRNVLREAWSRAVSLLPSRPWVARGALRLPSQNYGRWLCTAVDNTFGDAGIVDSEACGPWQTGLCSGRAWVVFVGEQCPDGGMSFDGLNAGVVGSEAVRGRGNLACAMAEPGLSLLGNNVQMEA